MKTTMSAGIKPVYPTGRKKTYVGDKLSGPAGHTGVSQGCICIEQGLCWESAMKVGWK